MRYINKEIPAITIRWYHGLVVSREYRAVPKLWSDQHNSHSTRMEMILVAETKGILDLVAAEILVKTWPLKGIISLTYMEPVAPS